VLAAVDGWGATFAAAAVVRAGEVVARHGDTTRVVRIASITKIVTAWAVLLAVEEGATALDEPLGPIGSTVRHLLAHAGGYDFDTDRVLAAPGTRRIYSNTGYDLLARHVEERSGLAFADYVAEGVLGPLDMTAGSLRGSAAKDLHACVEDLVSLVTELRSPRLLDPSTATAACSLQFPGLAGVLPGWGRQDPCDWGLGPELRGTKSPHWTGSSAPPTTYGHYGGAGTFLWVDPVADLACVVLTDREFDDWAVAAWPPFSDAVRAAYG
jgi:CubicO group peptidase (beta-lactamase class C family)